MSEHDKKAAQEAAKLKAKQGQEAAKNAAPATVKGPTPEEIAQKAAKKAEAQEAAAKLKVAKDEAKAKQKAEKDQVKEAKTAERASKKLERDAAKAAGKTSKSVYKPEEVINIFPAHDVSRGGTNPKRASGVSAGRFALYVDGMTVKDALAAGVLGADLTWDVGHRFITITPPAAG